MAVSVGGATAIGRNPAPHRAISRSVDRPNQLHVGSFAFPYRPLPRPDLLQAGVRSGLNLREFFFRFPRVAPINCGSFFSIRFFSLRSLSAGIILIIGGLEHSFHRGGTCPRRKELRSPWSARRDHGFLKRSAGCPSPCLDRAQSAWRQPLLSPSPWERLKRALCSPRSGHGDVCTDRMLAPRVCRIPA